MNQERPSPDEQQPATAEPKPVLTENPETETAVEREPDLTENPETETAVKPPSWTSADRYALALVTAVAGILRIARVASPSSLMFDEVYYAKDSCWYLLADPSICQIDVEQPQVHPPLAKWLLALGIRIFGFDSVGWRIASVVVGTLTVVLLYLLARKILHSTLGATLAAGLLALDFLHFVESRIAMLDIFPPLFGVAALLFITYDRDRMIARLENPDAGGNSILDRPWRLWAGLAGGAAVACKWTGGFYLVLIIMLTVVWEMGWRRKDGKGGVVARFIKEEAASIVVCLMVLPVVFYTCTYIGRIHGEFFTLPWSEGSWLGALIDQQKYMLDFHRGLDAVHPYQSPGWSWILLKRPVSYAFLTDSEGRYVEVLAAGNLLVWWPAILAILYTGYRWLKQRDFMAAPGAIFAGFMITYGPWLIPDFADRSAIFIFYLLPAIPFMCLALAYAGMNLAKSKIGLRAVNAYAALVVASFAFYYPLLANVALTQPKWDQRILFFDNCDKPPGHEVQTTITETLSNGATTAKPTTTITDSDLPPIGWCWI